MRYCLVCTGGGINTRSLKKFHTSARIPRPIASHSACFDHFRIPLVAAANRKDNFDRSLTSSGYALLFSTCSAVSQNVCLKLFFGAGLDYPPRVGAIARADAKAAAWSNRHLQQPDQDSHHRDVMCSPEVIQLCR